MKDTCRAVANIWAVLGIIGSISSAYFWGRELIGFNSYSGEPIYEQNMTLSFVVLLAVLFSTFVLYVILQAIAEILESQEMMEIMLSNLKTEKQTNPNDNYFANTQIQPAKEYKANSTIVEEKESKQQGQSHAKNQDVLSPIPTEDGSIECPVCNKIQSKGRKRCYNCGQEFL